MGRGEGGRTEEGGRGGRERGRGKEGGREGEPLPHLVKLIDADHTPISQHHGSALHNEITRYRVPHDTGRQSSCTAAFP